MSREYQPGSPEAVVEQTFRAFRERDGSLLAAVATPLSLQSYRDHVIQQTRSPEHRVTAETLRAHDPEMPQEVAEWSMERMERQRVELSQGLVGSFAGTRSLAELEGLSAVELLQRALRAAPQQAVEMGVCRVIGHVREGEDRAYVLFWFGTEEGPVLTDEPAIAALDRVDGEWRLVLDPFDRRGMPGFRNWFFAEARETQESDRSE